MKYIKCLVLLFLLAGCTRINEATKKESSKEEVRENEQTVSCVNDENQELLLFSKGDEIQQLQQSFVIGFEDAGIKEDMDKDEILSKIKASLDEEYQGIKGISVEESLVENGVLVQVMIDYTVADLNDLIDKGFVVKGERDSQYISLKESVESYTEKGYACELQ